MLQGYQRLLKARHRFAVSRARERLSPSLPEVGYGLLPSFAPKGVMGYQFWAALAGLGKPFLQNLHNPAVMVSPGASQQRLIRRLLDQHMFEPVLGMRRQPTLIEQ